MKISILVLSLFLANYSQAQELSTPFNKVNKIPKLCQLKKDEIETQRSEELKKGFENKAIAMISDYYKNNNLEKIVNINLVSTDQHEEREVFFEGLKYEDKGSATLRYKVDAGHDSATLDFFILANKRKLKVSKWETFIVKDALGRVTRKWLNCHIEDNIQIKKGSALDGDPMKTWPLYHEALAYTNQIEYTLRVAENYYFLNSEKNAYYENTQPQVFQIRLYLDESDI